MNYIDTGKLYDATDNGLAVFKYYFPNADDITNQNKKFKIRSGEKTPSARLSLYRGKWLITDFGNRGEVNGMNAINFVMWKEGLQYIDALRFIQEVVVGRDLAPDSFHRPQYKPGYEMREMTAADKKGHYNFTYKEKPSEKDLSVFGPFVTAEILEVFHCRAIEKYEFCSTSKKLKRDVVHIFSSNDDYPMFVFDYGDFKKVYKPLDQDKKHRFNYVGTKPTHYVYGLEQLRDADNEFVDDLKPDEKVKLPENKPNALVKDLVRVSGESDALNLYSLGFHVYWLNSESEIYKGDDYKTLDDLCENHYQVFDLDATGQKYAAKHALAHMNLHTIFLPEWLKKKKDWRGNPCKDVKDFVAVSGKDQDKTRTEFLRLKLKAKTIKFWTTSKDKNKGTTYNISLEHFYYFLNMHGFWITDSKYHNKSGECYARIQDKVVHLISPDDIKKIVKRFTKEWIRSKNFMYEIALLNKINSSTQISESNLQELPHIKFEFKNYNKTTEYLHFKNQSLKITPDNIEMVKHLNVPNYILGSLVVQGKEISHIIDKTIHSKKKSPIEVNATKEYQALLDEKAKEKDKAKREAINSKIASFPDLDKYTVTINDPDFVLVRFLQDLSHLHWRKELEQKEELSEKEKKEQDLLLANILFVIGYNTSEYKNQSKAWLTLLQDMLIGKVGSSSGRSGKSLLTKLISFVRSSFFIPGRPLSDSKNFQFLYDGYTQFHNNVEIDDFHEYGLFQNLYSDITGPRVINRKHLAQETIPAGESGKMIVSTNFELQSTDNSSLARVLNCGVSDYYHEKTKYNNYRETRSPYSKYDRLLYEDFTEQEWIDTYHLVAYCIQLQMRFNKIQPPMENLDKRQLRREMTKLLGKDEEFLSWARFYFTIGDTSKLPNSVKGIKVSPEDHGYVGTLILKKWAYDNFVETLTDTQARKFKMTQFKKAVAAYAEYMGWEFNPMSMCDGEPSHNPEGRRILRSYEGKSTEFMYIQKKQEKAPELTKEEEDDLPF